MLERNLKDGDVIETAAYSPILLIARGTSFLDYTHWLDRVEKLANKSPASSFYLDSYDLTSGKCILNSQMSSYDVKRILGNIFDTQETIPDFQSCTHKKYLKPSRDSKKGKYWCSNCGAYSND